MKSARLDLSLLGIFAVLSAVGATIRLPDCEIPENAITFHLPELTGVWYINAIVNYGANVNAMKCARAEFVTRNSRSAIEALNYFSNVTGAFTPDIYELYQARSGQIRLLNLRDKTREVYYYPLKFDDKSFVVSVCFLKDGKRLAQPISVFTKNAVQTEAFLESELKAAGVEIKQSYFVPNTNCYQ